jgi:hypothetical protein
MVIIAAQKPIVHSETANENKNCSAWIVNFEIGGNCRIKSSVKQLVSYFNPGAWRHR